MSSSASASAPADVDSFLRDLTALEREQEVTRITTAFKMNPCDILNVAHTATKSEVAKAYRTASLLVHPDKFPSGPAREQAQVAFTLLTAAKDDLADEAKREAFDVLVDEARQRVLTNYAAEARKKRKTEGQAEASEDASNDPAYDSLVRAEVKEILIDREWRKRQLLKAAAAEDALAAADKARRAAEREAKDAESKEWESGRDDRINSWRDFQKGATKKKSGKKRPLIGLMKMPKMHQEDPNDSFIKRPVTHQSSEK